MAIRFYSVKCIRLFGICALATAAVTLFIGLITPENYDQHGQFRISLFSTDRDSIIRTLEPSSMKKPENNNMDVNTSSIRPLTSHKLGVIVPFRDRLEELLEFVPYIHKFLSAQNISHTIYVINQADEYRFNRASLINIGFLHSLTSCDYIAMHDVDLLPLNPGLVYRYPEIGPYHIAAPNLHPRYHYPKFIGGILLLTREQFMMVNGLSNRFWGWGREDDELYVRIKNAGLQIIRPEGITTGSHDTFRHIHGKKRKRDMKWSREQREASRRLDQRTGVDNVAYTLKTIVDIIIAGAPVRFLSVHLTCNISDTPWCMRIETAVPPLSGPL